MRGDLFSLNDEQCEGQAPTSLVGTHHTDSKLNTSQEAHPSVSTDY
jgi:hypothetical protein